MADVPPLSLEYPLLSADGVALVLRRTAEATALELERRFEETGLSLYRSVPGFSRAMYSGELSEVQVLAAVPDTKRNRSLRAVIRAVAKYAKDRAVICHPQPLRIVPFRAGFGVAVKVPFVFVERGRAWWWYVQCRGNPRLLVRQLGLVGALIGRAYEDLPEYATAGLELIDCVPPMKGDSDRIGIRRGLDTLPAWSREDLDKALGIYADALILVGKSKPKLVQEAVARQKRRLTQPGANPWLF